jgi:CRISPR type IV-associated protein Csf1
MSNCYLCGAENALHKLNLKDSFTAHSLAKCPHSDKLCDRCEYSINLVCFYWNENKLDKKTKKPKPDWSKLFARNWSWLYQGKTLIAPVFNGEKEGFPIVENLPTRELIREWIINPPEPPFTIAIAESGQKHILFLAQEAQSKDLFPVLFELDILFIKRKEFTNLVNNFETLMGMGATKTEIVTGYYKSQFLLNNLTTYDEFESIISTIRGSRLLDLISYVAIAKKQEIVEKPIKKEAVKQPPIKEFSTQLSLF